MTESGCHGEYPCRRLVKSKTRVHDLSETTPGDDAGAVSVTTAPILHPYQLQPHRKVEKTVAKNAATCTGALHKSPKLFFNWSCARLDLGVLQVIWKCCRMYFNLLSASSRTEDLRVYSLWCSRYKIKTQ